MNKEKAKSEARDLIDYCYRSFCYINYNSNGIIMTKKEVMPRVVSIARSHIRKCKQYATEGTEYLDLVLEEIDNLYQDKYTPQTT